MGWERGNEYQLVSEVNWMWVGRRVKDAPRCLVYLAARLVTAGTRQEG